ncbi:adenylosuccinate synthase [Mycoplasma sp. SG1]|uniref:adenylosuccinate synthase n=1 Tax=Mycoplasma sp. SG1 TaxID=2810348 RepID=UPI0020252FE3|nr:adenylosuccinate synthase [Mycoplasma sp. SG1]URM53023.1 adenylosuccinate synthase [Mycoplasma sp. SG1]
MITVLLGAFWGDEGKGKIINYLSQRNDLIIRYQGGNNAGHTIYYKNIKIKLSLLPSGITTKNTNNLIASGVALNPDALLQEVDNLKKSGLFNGKLYISENVHLILPYHLRIDELTEKSKGSDKIGTTKKGIGPCYQDKIARVGIRLVDIEKTEAFYNKIKNTLFFKNIIFKHFNLPQFSADQIFEYLLKVKKDLKPYIINPQLLLDSFIKENKKILFEGAQGSLLCYETGTYPYTTSSSPTSSMVFLNSNLGLRKINKIIAVSKAYTTRVGEGPFVTELFDETATYLREKGNEYGTVTKRPRRIGWLDLFALKYSIKVNSFTEIIITLIDVLSGLKEIKVCVGYQLNGEEIDYFPLNSHILKTVKPIYKVFKGWDEDITKITNYNNLPSNCKNYLQFIEDFINVPIKVISNGPKKNNIIFKNNNKTK